MASDGQVTFGNTVVKHAARKIRRLYNERVLAGFAGSAADSFALFSRFEAKLVVMDLGSTYLLSGTGDLIEPDDGIIAIGSGGPYAMAAAKALALHTELDARAIAEHSMRIAGEICIYTNENITIEAL